MHDRVETRGDSAKFLAALGCEKVDSSDTALFANANIMDRHAATIVAARNDRERFSH